MSVKCIHSSCLRCLSPKKVYVIIKLIVFRSAYRQVQNGMVTKSLFFSSFKNFQQRENKTSIQLLILCIVDKDQSVTVYNLTNFYALLKVIEKDVY